MLALGLILNTVGIGLFCWLIFTLAVYALPFFVALNAGMLAFHSGAGVIGALLVGIVAGALTLGDRSNRFRNDAVSDLACRHRGRCSPFRPPLLAIMSFSRCRRSACRRLLGGRSSLASARSSSAVRHGRD